MEPRLIVKELPSEGKFLLPQEEARHVLTSLRMREGDSLVLCDGQRREALCRLAAGGEVEILEIRASKSEPQTLVHLYPSLSKGERFEWMVQKAVELGVTSITPVLSERCVAQIPSKEKQERLLRIIKGAVEQSGRGILPELRKPKTLKDVMGVEEGKKLICYEEENGTTLKAELEKAGELPVEISVMTGPEGGYSPHEVTDAVQSGWKSVSLGGCILRCETAPLMVLSAIRYLELDG